MYQFEEFCTRWGDHNSAINENKTLDNLPTVRVKYSNKYKLAITLHKWKLFPSGEVLAIFPFGPEIDETDRIWTEPSQSQYFKSLQKMLQVLNEKMQNEDMFQLVEGIENGENTDIIVYKYHANQWRQIEKKKTKWAYLGKQEKTEICNIQRLLQ